MSNDILCVDLGGTNMRVAVVDERGQIRCRANEPTPRDARCPEALEQLMASVREQAGGRGTFEAIVVGVPGRIDYSAGRLDYAPNLPPTWVTELSEEHLATHFDAPVLLANDADLAAVGEAYFGAGHQYTDIVYITISTGIGAGVVFNGQLLRGTRSLAEIGHTILALDSLDTDEPATAEHLTAGPALARRADELGVSARGAGLVSLVRDGDPAARRAWNATMRAAGATIANLAHLFSPDVIVIGGGVGRNDALVRDPVFDLVRRHGPQGLGTPIEVAQAALGDDSGLIGGAAWPRAIGRVSVRRA